MKKLALLLSTSLLLGTVAGADFDDTADHWAAEYIDYCAEIGILNGVSDTEFLPDETLTVAQSVVAIAKLHMLFEKNDEPKAGETWYDAYVEYLLDLDVSIPEDLNAPCTRYEFFGMLEAVVREGKLTAINKITSLPDTDNEGILSFYNAGIISGMDEYGTFYGENCITRGECAAMLARLGDYTIRLKFSLEEPEDSDAMDRLYLPSDTVVMTVGITDITADVYTAYMSYQVEAEAAIKQMTEHPEYEWYFDLWNTGSYLGNFERYLSEMHGVNDFDPTDFDANDSAIRASVEANIIQYATLLELCEKYSCTLTDEQNEAVAYFVENSKFTGDSRLLYSQCEMEKNLMIENLAAALKPSESKIASLLATGEYLCAEYISFSKYDEEGLRLSDSEIAYIFAGVEMFRLEVADTAGHFRLEYLAKDIATEYSGIYPTIYSASETDSALWAQLKALLPSGYSKVLEDDDAIYFYLVSNPQSDEALMEVVRENYGHDLADIAIRDYSAYINVSYIPEVSYVSVSEFANNSN